MLTINDNRLKKIKVDKMDLDGFEAISVPEEQLDAFNNCVTFVKEEKL